MLDRTDRLLRRLATMLIFLAAFAAAAITVLVILSATMRYVVRTPFRFTEELVGLLFLASSMLSLPYVAAHRQTIRVAILLRFLPERLRILGDLFDAIVVFAFSVWFTRATLDYCLFAADLETRSEQADILLWPWITLMPFCSLLIAVITLVQILLRLTRPEGGPQPLAGAHG